ncbi:MAG TPA: redoxin domain-containing protein [Methylophaga sp.]|nr:redoxin domain-containing protein [Methylophaga sp.]
MQDLIKNMHSKRFLLIYLAVVALLLIVYMGQQISPNSDDKLKSIAPGAYQLNAPESLPNFLLRDKQQHLYTNADLRSRWHFIYLYDGACEPHCQAIWQVLSNLADRFAGQQLGFWVIDASQQQQLFNTSPALPGNVQIICDPNGDHPLRQFFAGPQGVDALMTTIFLINPNGQWQAAFRAPYTSVLLQRWYLQLRRAFANAPKQGSDPMPG